MASVRRRGARLAGALLVGGLLFTGAACGSDGDADEQGAPSPSTTSEPTTTSAAPTTTTTAPPVTAPPAAAGVPVARFGGASPEGDDELDVWARDHDVTIEWYSGGTTMVAVYRGLPLDGAPLCLSNALEPVAFTEFEGATMAPTGDGGCEGGDLPAGTVERCNDVWVYDTQIPNAPAASRLFADVQLWIDGGAVTDLNALEFLEAPAPAFDPAALGC